LVLVHSKVDIWCDSLLFHSSTWFYWDLLPLAAECWPLLYFRTSTARASFRWAWNPAQVRCKRTVGCAVQTWARVLAGHLHSDCFSVLSLPVLWFLGFPETKPIEGVHLLLKLFASPSGSRHFPFVAVSCLVSASAGPVVTSGFWELARLGSFTPSPSAVWLVFAIHGWCSRTL
jgi:hypothetical protein